MVIDTLQTLPSFVYLMPAVMLFRVGDFTAMIAIVAYAVAPAIRYTVLGLRAVDPRLIEAGRAMGCTRVADPDGGSGCRWRCRRSCWASTRRSCSRSRCW